MVTGLGPEEKDKPKSEAGLRIYAKAFRTKLILLFMFLFFSGITILKPLLFGLYRELTHQSDPWSFFRNPMIWVYMTIGLIGLIAGTVAMINLFRHRKRLGYAGLGKPKDVT